MMMTPAVFAGIAETMELAKRFDAEQALKVRAIGEAESAVDEIGAQAGRLAATIAKLRLEAATVTGTMLKLQIANRAETSNAVAARPIQSAYTGMQLAAAAAAAAAAVNADVDVDGEGDTVVDPKALYTQLSGLWAHTPSAAVVALVATRDRLATALIDGADSPGPAIASPTDVAAAAAKCRHELEQLDRERADLERANQAIADEIQQLKLPSMAGLPPLDFVVAVDAALGRVLTSDSVERTGLDDELAKGYHDALTEKCWNRVTAHLEQLSDDNIIMVIATAAGTMAWTSFLTNLYSSQPHAAQHVLCHILSLLHMPITC